MKESRIAYVAIGYLGVKLLVTGFCGRFIHRHGIRRVLWACGPLYTLFFLAYLFCTPERTWPLYAAWALVGLADAAFSIAAAMALYDSVPETPGRPVYFAIANVLSIGIFCIGGVVAVPILEALQERGRASRPDHARAVPLPLRDLLHPDDPRHVRRGIFPRARKGLE